MSILITGGLGFIGGHLCKYFLSKKEKVIIFDDASFPVSKNISFFSNCSDIEIYFQDVNCIDESLFRSKNITEVYHFASPSNSTFAMMSPKKMIEVNSKEVFRLYNLSKKFDARFLFISSIKASSDNVREDDLYSFGKYLGEVICFNCRVKVARLANVYGPFMRSDDPRVLPSFIRKALCGEDIKVIKNAGIDSFLFISDLIKGLTFMMESDKELVEFGSEESISIKGLAEKIVRISGSKSKILEVNNDIESYRKIANLYTAKSVLKWAPIVSLEDGLKETLNYFRKEMSCDLIK